MGRNHNVTLTRDCSVYRELASLGPVGEMIQVDITHLARTTAVHTLDGIKSELNGLQQAGLIRFAPDPSGVWSVRVNA